VPPFRILTPHGTAVNMCGMPVSNLGALRVVDRKKWERVVRAALAAHPGRTEAAHELGVSTRTLSNWTRELGSENKSFERT